MNTIHIKLVKIAAFIVYLFLFMPLIVVVLFSFSDKSYFSFPPSGFSLRWYVAAWDSGLFLTPALRSLALATLCTLIAAVITIPVTLGLRQMERGRVKSVIEFFILSPLIVPALIIGIALLYTFNRLGILDTFTALVLSHSVIVLPYMFRSVYISAVGLRQNLVEASEILGASPRMTFFNVMLPALFPGVISGAIFSFIISLDQFTVSLFVTQAEQTVLPVAIYKYLSDMNDPVTAAVSTVLVVFGLLLALIIDRLGWLRHLSGGGA
ncbi:ABC transporter permease [Ochrobactrum sp. Q0168]|uniref:ABC transporter permease n=1 Tax=Ochrobactrum sp. Q0168 TaxID=2793241 RepID=UPI0018EE2B77|nr:ABC transporter permease [Ochrobactrum sp. Q0168]